MKATRIDHVAIVVADIDAAAASFQSRFGLVPLSDAVVAEGALRMAYLAAGDTMLQLISPLRPGPFADFLAERGEGLHHICFAVPSVAEAALPADLAVLPAALGGMGALVRFLAAPLCGTTIELTEPPSEPPSEPSPEPAT